MNLRPHMFFRFKPGEFGLVVPLFSFFFLVIAIFQMLYPLKKGLFVGTFGAELELYAKLLNIVVAAVAVGAYTVLYNRLTRIRLIDTIGLFFSVLFVYLAVVLSAGAAVNIWVFYLLGDLVTTVMVATFWALATDLASSEQAKRLFGVVGAGGIVGGVAGSFLARLLREPLGTSGLLLLAAGMMFATAISARLAMQASSKLTAGRMPTTPDGGGSKPGSHKGKTDKQGAELLEGARLVLQSKYLLAIVGIMFFYEIASQTMDFQFSRVGEQLTSVAETQAYFADVRLYANIVSVIVQFFLVSLIMRTAGVLTALLVLPGAVITSSLSFWATGTAQSASLLHISDNGLNYSIQQTSRESLYTVTSPDEKYKARAFTNMFMQRFAKGVSILSILVLSGWQVGVQSLSWLAIAMAVAMIACSVYAGRRFSAADDLSASGAAPEVA